MDSVMRNPQLLEEIFDTGYDGEHVLAYALVCKAWSDPALNLLWKVVTPPKLLWLFGILSPLKRVKRNTEAGRRAEQVFTLERDPTLEDWQRFQYYSRRVKVLEYMESDTHSSMDQSAFDSLALIRSQGPIFPNLRIFFVDISLPNAVMFLHSGIRQLYIVILTDQDPENDRDFLDHVSLRVPDLTILWISMQHSSLVANVIQQLCPILPYEEEVVQILSQQTRLQQLNLPKFWATTKVVNAVSHLDSLQSILVMKPSYPGHPLESVNFSPFSSLNTRKLALPALQRLMLTVPYTAFHSFLQRWVTPHLQFFSALHELKLQSQLLESSETLKESQHIFL
ncbi:hypothetical protein BDN72DRAFT_957403 [Pluteus cervinus]|uniref:Uncharacterized protein n=1 Tax=Pluteus cervinus TaxID=181527 RepID=A0ACD3B300_9AGAR|nr:hypothetical protein BDN72DRAFT_957403 [Pluteus cervinus]